MLSSIKDLISEIGKWVHFNLFEMRGIDTWFQQFFFLTLKHLANVSYNQE